MLKSSGERRGFCPRGEGRGGRGGTMGDGVRPAASGGEASGAGPRNAWARLAGGGTRGRPFSLGTSRCPLKRFCSTILTAAGYAFSLRP